MSNEKKELQWNYNNRKISRKFTAEWSVSGFINMDKLPEMVESVIVQRKQMIAYIELLHDKIDDLIEKNNICDCPSCHRAGCTSDHK